MLALQEDESSAAEELGLLDLNPDSERLLLFQLPSLLPVPAASLSPAKPNTPVKPLTHPEASSLHQLPAGKVSFHPALQNHTKHGQPPHLPYTLSSIVSSRAARCG